MDKSIFKSLNDFFSYSKDYSVAPGLFEHINFEHFRKDGVQITFALFFYEKKIVVICDNGDKGLATVEIYKVDFINCINGKKIEIIGTVKNKSKTKLLLDLEGPCILNFEIGG